MRLLPKNPGEKEQVDTKLFLQVPPAAPAAWHRSLMQPSASAA